MLTLADAGGLPLAPNTRPTSTIAAGCARAAGPDSERTRSTTWVRPSPPFTERNTPITWRSPRRTATTALSADAPSVLPRVLGPPLDHREPLRDLRCQSNAHAVRVGDDD